MIENTSKYQGIWALQNKCFNFFNILCHMMYQCQIENYPLVSQDVLHFISSFKSYVHISYPIAQTSNQYELWIRKNSDNWELKKICWRVSYRYFQDRKINLNFILLAKQICMLFQNGLYPIKHCGFVNECFQVCMYRYLT